MPTVKQGLEQKLQQKLSPLQIQTIKLIEMPVQARPWSSMSVRS